MSGFFDSVRENHPYSHMIGKRIGKRTIVETYNKCEERDIWGTPYVLFDDGTELKADKVIEIEKEINMDKNKKTPMTLLSLTAEDRALLKDLANRDGCSMTGLVRRALELYVKIYGSVGTSENVSES
jgi:hypothetical protein